MLERIWNNKREKNIHLIWCKDCGFAYYSVLLTDEDAAKFYSGYRNDEFQKQRQKYEPWVTKRLLAFSDDELEYKHRQNYLTGILKKHINIDRIKEILDYGGDDGRFIPAIFSDKSKYIYDISNVVPNKNIVKIEFDSKQKYDFDFIMCCHVLEHLSNPRVIIEKIKSLLSEEGVLYIELPMDSPFYKIKRDYLFYLFHYNPIDLLSRVLLDKNQPYRMGEHINYFTVESIVILLKEFGFEILHSGTYSLRTKRIGIVKYIGVLAKRKIE